MNNAKKLVEKIRTFLLDAYTEFKKVTWPSKDQTIRLTGYVLGVSLGVALFVWAIDLVLKELLSTILIR